MRFTCTRENLHQALNIVGGVTQKQTNLPILSNILIRVEDTKVTLIVTDLEIAVRTTVRAKVEEQGEFTVPAKTFIDYIGLVSDEQVEIVLDKNELVVTSGNASTKIKGTPADDYPVIPEVQEGKSYEFVNQHLKDGLGQTLIAAAKNDIRPELAGIHFGLFTERHDGLVLAATDSYRLAERKLSVKTGSDTHVCIVPARTAQEIVRVLTLLKTEEGVKITLSEGQLAAEVGHTTIISRLVEGKYPDYVQIIPEDFKTIAQVPTDLLAKKIKAASLFTTTGVNAVTFDLQPGQSVVGIASTSTQTGEHSAQIDAAITGDENSILLNHRYVLDGLNQLGDDDIEFCVNSADAPCLLRGTTNQEYLYIVMPIRQ